MDKEYNCLVCGKKFSSNKKKAFTCGNKKCVDKHHHFRKREYYIKNTSNWEKLNPKKTAERKKRSCDKFRNERRDRFNELMRESYQRNKSKHFSIVNTYKILNGIGYKKYNSLKKECKICKSKDSLRIYCEEYYSKKLDIINLIDKGKIYYVCKKHKSRRDLISKNKSI